jgi:hypothetical protein
MFPARHSQNFASCPHSTLTTSQYHGLGRCGLNGRSSSPAVWMASCGGPERVDRNCVVGGGGAEPCPATCCRTPNQRSPDLPAGVSTASLSTAWRRLPEPTERGSGYLGLDLAQVYTCTKINVSKINIICVLYTYFVILHTMCTLSTIHAYRAHSEHSVHTYAHLVHRVQCVHTRCTPDD